MRRESAFFPVPTTHRDFMLHSELETWQRAGISPVDVLTLATLGCASYLGLDRELGSVTRGKRADLLLLAGDPTRDVGD